VARVFKQQYTKPIPEGAERVTHKGLPAVRFRGPDGTVGRVPLSENKAAAEILLNDLLRKAGKIAVKAVNHYGDEILKVYRAPRGFPGTAVSTFAQMNFYDPSPQQRRKGP
jgi:hypothetical protein